MNKSANKLQQAERKLAGLCPICGHATFVKWLSYGGNTYAEGEKYELTVCRKCQSTIKVTERDNG